MQVDLCKKAIMMIGMYHPPYSGHNLITTNMFIDDLMEWLEESLVNDKT